MKYTKRICVILAVAVLLCTGCGRDGSAITEDDSSTVAEDAGNTVTENAGNAVKEIQKEEDEDMDDVSCPYEMTSLPVVTVETNGQEISWDKIYSEATMSFYSPDGSYTKTELQAGIRRRGNASKGFEKGSYKFRLEEKRNLYSMANGKGRIWVLISNHCDQSLLRNRIALELQRSFDGIAWSPNCISVVLYLNGEYQ